jgi:hypothetical protein
VGRETEDEILDTLRRELLVLACDQNSSHADKPQLLPINPLLS